MPPSPAKSKAPTAAGYLLVFLLVETLAILTVLHLPGVPYNVRELFGSSFVSAKVFLFSLLTLWIGLAPAVAGRVVTAVPRLALATPFFAIVIAQASYYLLRLSVTIESMNDILGSRLWNWPGNWERLARFWALDTPLTIFLIVFSAGFLSARAYGRAIARRLALATLLNGLPWIILSGLVVFHWPSTDNLVELVRSAPSPWLGPTLLTLLTALLAGNAVWLASSPPGGFRPTTRRLLFTLAMVGPGWLLLFYGLEPAVEKYGLTFPALRFLLGASRSHEIGWFSLFLRWIVVQSCATGCLAAGVWFANRLLPLGTSRSVAPAAGQSPTPDGGTADRRTQETSISNNQNLARVSLALALLSLAVIVVGLYEPLDRSSVGSSPWREFFMMALRAGNVRDVVENVLLACPAGLFLGINAYARQKGHLHTLVFGFVAVSVVALPSELLQLWMPFRHPSALDVAALATGGAVGAWFAWANRGRIHRAWAHLATTGGLVPWSAAVLWVTANWVPGHLRLTRDLLLRGVAPMLRGVQLQVPHLVTTTACWVGVFTLLGRQLSVRGSALLLLAAWGGQTFSPGRAITWEAVLGGAAAWVWWATTTARGRTRWGPTGLVLVFGVFALRLFQGTAIMTPEVLPQLPPFGELITLGKLRGLPYVLEALVLVLSLTSIPTCAPRVPHAVRARWIWACGLVLVTAELGRAVLTPALPGTTTLFALWLGTLTSGASPGVAAPREGIS
ncbi:MAG: hypothetical protein P1P84_03745 [Deferrisomatales bacterium]|nr:hypothetical protein [Deferrisomatales bacterium]